MKKILTPLGALIGLMAIAAIIEIFFELNLRAAEPIQAYQPLTPAFLYVTNRTATPLTNSLGGHLTIDCSRQRNVAVRLMIQMDDTSTDNNNFFLYNSADSVHFSTKPCNVITVPGISAGQAIEVVTNIDTFGAAAIQFGYVTNVGTAATANITNMAVGYSYKTLSP